MQGTLFYRTGIWLYRMRWALIVLWLAALCACIPFMPYWLTPFKTTGFINEKSESKLTEVFLNKKLGYINYNKFIIIYHSNNLLATNPQYKRKINQSLNGLKKLRYHHIIFLPSDNKKQIAKDKHTAYVTVLVKSSIHLSNTEIEEIRSLIKTPRNMSVYISGEGVYLNDLNKQTGKDIYKADYIAIPVALLTLILVFGSLVAALLPLVLGGVAAIFILTGIYFIGLHCTLSIFTVNIALLLGLCLSLDYALFVTSRFRDELDKGLSTSEAIAVTHATAGQAVLFSGIAVFASLSALLLFPINILFSVAVGGMTAVFFAVLTATVLLPAVLAVVNTKINWLPVNILSKGNSNYLWHWLAQKVVKHPVFYFVTVFTLLLFLGFPSLYAKFGVSDYRVLPEGSVYRQAFDTYAKHFNENETIPVLIVVKPKSGSMLSQKNISRLYDLARKIEKKPGVARVNSIVTTSKELSKLQYYRLYSMSKNKMDKHVKELLETTTQRGFSVMTVVEKYHINSPQTKTLINDLRQLKSPYFTFQFSGKPFSNDDLITTIQSNLPHAIVWVLVFTYIILFILLRSIFLPFKAILMNMLSLCACYGALHLVFQEGYLHEYLNFEPQGMLDISLLVIIFCALFGFSMDYEVFLLTRIKERYDATGDNKNSIIFGIEKSSKIITSAALIVMVTCGSFLFADVLVVKAFGLGIAVAIFIDAFLIRSLLVPATMVLVAKWNWYIPKWLDKITPRL